jgi:hypothetical protein
VVLPFGEAHNHNVEGPWEIDARVSRYLRNGGCTICTMCYRWTFLVVLSVVFGVGSAPASGWAHPSPATSPVVARPAPAPDEAPSTWTSQHPAAGSARLLALVSGTLGVVLITRHRRTRPIRLLALALLVVIAGFEGTIHSVHHLDDPADAGRCLVATTAEHVSAAGIASPPIAVSITPVAGRAPIAPPATARSAAPVPVAGRSPPA